MNKNIKHKKSCKETCKGLCKEESIKLKEIERSQNKIMTRLVKESEIVRSKKIAVQGIDAVVKEETIKAKEIEKAEKILLEIISGGIN